MLSHVCQTIWNLFATINNHAHPRQSADTAAASTTGVTGPAAGRASPFLGRSEAIPRQSRAGHDDAITRHHYKPLYAICFNVFAYQCRAPLYFAYQFSHKKFSQKLTHDQQSTAIWKNFKEIAPNRKDGSKAFRRFLGIVNKEAPKALPIEVDD